MGQKTVIIFLPWSLKWLIAWGCVALILSSLSSLHEAHKLCVVARWGGGVTSV